jgi:4'-phosphopantetheinyl transferase
LYGVTRIGELGVDLEVVKPNFETSEAEDIARRFFSPAEVESLNQLHVADRKRAFFRYWVCKEAFIKAKGEGLSCPLDTFDVGPAIRSPPVVTRIDFGRNEAQDWGCGSWRLTMSIRRQFH